mmetsp:Transcript_96834/g.273890  ORF Transcript_96834/g.273890 Transcript_96834/m.273890 type:complete len:202 (-) Transcript_96834:432-1037(-)
MRPRPLLKSWSLTPSSSRAWSCTASKSSPRASCISWALREPILSKVSMLSLIPRTLICNSWARSASISRACTSRAARSSPSCCAASCTRSASSSRVCASSAARSSASCDFVSCCMSSSRDSIVIDTLICRSLGSKPPLGGPSSSAACDPSKGRLAEDSRPPWGSPSGKPCGCCCGAGCCDACCMACCCACCCCCCEARCIA